MGFDIDTYLLYGFKIPLSVAFKSNLLDPNVVNSDDYQLMDEEEVINRNILSPIIKEILKNDKWNVYILTSSQDDANPETSYFFLYDKKDLLYSETTDYGTEEIENPNEDEEVTKLLNNKISTPDNSWVYKLHYVIESSW